MEDASLTIGILLALGVGYLLGSIPFGWLFVRAAGGGDVRDAGSGGTGATNVLRTGGKALGAATLAADAGKGALAVWLAATYLGGDLAALLAGLMAFAGHLFPVWLRWRGGKGVAVYVGALAVMAWQLAVLFGAVWLLVALVSRYSSAASLCGALLVFLFVLWNTSEAQLALSPLIPFFVGTCLAMLVWTHRENIQRLRRGEEMKLGHTSVGRTRDR